jgi:hypothetical protein
MKVTPIEEKIKEARMIWYDHVMRRIFLLKLEIFMMD